MRKSDSSTYTTFPSLLTVTRTLGALALLVVGAVHFQQYQYEFYSSIPTIGPLFLANFVAATALGLFLLVPIRHPRGRLRKLVDEAKRNNGGTQMRRAAQEAAYHFMAAMAGDMPGFEEATRALFANDRPRFEQQVSIWPGHVRAYATRLAFGGPAGEQPAT